jgi:hypothetical protein
MRVRTVVVLLAVLANTACIDFVEPVFPPTGPAVFSASAIIFTDGTAGVQAHLIPGIDTNHLWRAVAPDTLRVDTAAIPSSSIQADNQRDYNGTVTVNAVRTGVVRIQLPGVVGLAPPPVMSFPLVQGADPDTVQFTISAPFLLHVRVPPNFATDFATVSRSWLIEISDGKRSFRLGGDGPPPATITVPVEYQPLAQPGISTATLSVFESRRVDQPDYIAVYSLSTRVRWFVRTFTN